MLIPNGETSTEAPATTEATTEQTTNTESTENTQQTTTEDKPGYLYADGIKGEGDTPEWFDSNKYKNISEQAKGYKELEGKFGAFTGTPKDGYKIEGVDMEESPLLKLMGEWGTENQLSNDGLSSIIDKVNALAAEQIEQDSINAKKSLGENADKRLGDISQWGKNNLSPEQFEQFQGLAQTAGHVEVIEKLIGMTKNSKLVTSDHVSTESTIAGKEEALKAKYSAKNDKGQRLMDIDPEYRQKVDKEMAAFYTK